MCLFTLYCYNRAMKNHTAVKNRLILAIVLAFLPFLAQAETVNDLYRTVVPVVDQSKAEQLRAMRIGLGKVLVKVTGDSQAMANIAFSNPERYVTEFGYVSYRDPQTPEAAASGTGMSLSYAASAIDRLLRKYQLQVWPSDRPGLLVWMVVDGAGGKSFVTQENMPAAVSSLKLLMEDRGAPLILPLLDLQDTRNVSENDVWNLNLSKLASAAERYKTNAWLAIRFYQSSSGQWRAARLLNLNGEDDLQNVVANTLPALINKIIPEAVDNLASHYAYVPNTDTEEVMLHLENINDYKSFNQAVGYLESLEVVRRLTVSEVDDHRLMLRLFVEGEVNLLLDTLRRDKRMTEKNLPPLMIPGLNDSNTSVNDATNILSQTQNLYFMWGRQ
jgi:hypothetical protein